jgi:hypothetical protein
VGDRQLLGTTQSLRPTEERAPQIAPDTPSQTTSRCVPSTAVSNKLWIFSLSTSRARRASVSSPLRRATFQTRPSASSQAFANAGGVLRLCPQHPLPSLPLHQGGPVLRIPDANCSAISRHSSLLSRCFHIKHRYDMGNLCSSGCLLHLGQPCLQHRRVRAPPGQMMQKQR